MPHEQSFIALFYRHGITTHRHAALFCLAHPLLRASGKDKTMKRIPKTPIEFDYDLWTTEDGQCMVRVKRTGEQCEVSRETFRILRTEEKKLRRSMTGVPVSESNDTDETATLLSLDYVSVAGAEEMSPAWLEDSFDMENSVITRMLEEELRHSLTERQLGIYLSCVVGGISYKDYADANGMTYQNVQQSIVLIRKKAQKIFF